MVGFMQLFLNKIHTLKLNTNQNTLYFNKQNTDSLIIS